MLHSEDQSWYVVMSSWGCKGSVVQECLLRGVLILSEQQSGYLADSCFGIFITGVCHVSPSYDCRLPLGFHKVCCQACTVGVTLLLCMQSRPCRGGLVSE